jgi:hypothetical protein
MTGFSQTPKVPDTSDPTAEPRLKVETREELVYLVGQACEIEHGLMCEYLYAQFSLKRGPGEGLTPGQLAGCRPGKRRLSTSSSRRCCTWR